MHSGTEESFAAGVGKNANRLYLVDFGLADWYVNENSEHVEQSKTSGDMRGTIRYASINKHNALSGELQLHSPS